MASRAPPSHRRRPRDRPRPSATSQAALKNCRLSSYERRHWAPRTWTKLQVSGTSCTSGKRTVRAFSCLRRRPRGGVKATARACAACAAARSGARSRRSSAASRRAAATATSCASPTRSSLDRRASGRRAGDDGHGGSRPLPRRPQDAIPSRGRHQHHQGRDRLFFFGEVGTQVRFFERVGERRASRWPPASSARGYDVRIRDVTTWRCDRLTRRFAAEAVTPTGSR